MKKSLHGKRTRNVDPHLEAAKAGSWAQLLFQCARLINERALAQVQRRMGLAIRPSHTSLFPYIELEGTRPSVLAQKLGISKQAVGQMVEALCEMGIVERVPDPGDARAQLVRFSRKGRKGLLQGLALLSDLESELAATVGAADIQHLHATLLRLASALNAQ